MQLVWGEFCLKSFRLICKSGCMKTSTGLDVVVVDEGTVYQLQLERADCEKNLHNVIEGKDRVAVPPKRRHAKPLF